MLNQLEKDKKLLELIKKHPNKGMNLLMNEYGGLVFYVVQKRLQNNMNDIEECVSDVFIDFYSNINSVNLNKGSIKAFLVTIATRRAIDTYRRNSVHQEVYSLDDEHSFTEYMLPKENADALPYAILEKCKDENGKIRYENLDVVMRSAIVAAYTNMELPETRDELYILVNHTDIFSVILKNANTAQLNTIIRLVGYEPYFIRGELCQ